MKRAWQFAANGARRSAGAALLGLGLLLSGQAQAQDGGAITEVTQDSPETVAFSCTGIAHEVVLRLRADIADAFYIQEGGGDVALPVTCATAPIGLSAQNATISCNTQLQGTAGMKSMDGIDLADALAKALGADACRRTR